MARLLRYLMVLGATLSVLTVVTASEPASAARVSPGSVPFGEGVQLPVDPDADPDRTRQRADEIVSGPEYQQPGPDNESPFARLRRWITDRMPDVDGPDGIGGPQGFDGIEAFGVALIVMVILVAAGAGWYVLSGARRRRVAEDDDDVDVEIVPLRTTSEWEDEAVRCRDAGDHRGAVRAWFRAATTTLVDRGVIPDVAGRTAAEMRHDVAQRSAPTSAVFDRLAQLFEAVWYGGRAADSTTTDEAQSLVDEIRRASRPKRSRLGTTEAGPSDSVGMPEEAGR